MNLSENIAAQIDHELRNIPEKYNKPFNSNHEGYAVLLEEVRELENEIFFGLKPIQNQFGFGRMSEEKHKEAIRKEAVQVAAMAVRIIQDLT